VNKISYINQYNSENIICMKLFHELRAPIDMSLKQRDQK